LTQIFFYHGAADRMAAAAGLIAKAWAQRKGLVIYAPEAGVAAGLDRQLWVAQPTGFVPHVAGDSPLATETPVVIARSAGQLEEGPQGPAGHERLMNLSGEIPPGFSRFASVIEVVSEEDDVRGPARERFKFYKDRGYEVQTIDLTGKV